MEPAESVQQDTPSDDPACLGDRINAPSVSVLPDWASWQVALSARRTSPARAAMGFDPLRSIVMSGHQPVVFHNGILAKLIALDEASKRTGAIAVWIVPDQDAVEVGAVRVPVGSRASLSADRVELVQTSGRGIAVGSLPAAEVDEPEHESLKDLAVQLDQYAGMNTLAGQFGYATIEHACGLLGIETPRLIFASELFGVDEFAGVIETMRQDPLLCAQSYNLAARKHPDAGVRALVIEGDRVELPLWGCRAGESRVAIDSLNIGSFDPQELLPRGLLMSAMARAYLADLFIHGTGGWVYDRISEDWFSDWLGIELAPMAMVTATQHLDLGFSPDETIDADQARWEMHHARHTPAMVGDHERQRIKDELVSQISALDPKDARRDGLYQELQSLLVIYRVEHADEIEAFAQRARLAVLLKDQYRVAQDRTWAFVHFGQDALLTLDRATRSAMS